MSFIRAIFFAKCKATKAYLSYWKPWVDIKLLIFKSTCKIECIKGNMILITLVIANDFHSDCISERAAAKRSAFHETISRYTILLSPFRDFIGISNITRSRSELFVIISKTAGTSHTCLISETNT